MINEIIISDKNTLAFLQLILGIEKINSNLSLALASSSLYNLTDFSLRLASFAQHSPHREKGKTIYLDMLGNFNTSHFEKLKTKFLFTDDNFMTIGPCKDGEEAFQAAINYIHSFKPKAFIFDSLAWAQPSEEGKNCHLKLIKKYYPQMVLAAKNSDTFLISLTSMHEDPSVFGGPRPLAKEAISLGSDIILELSPRKIVSHKNSFNSLIKLIHDQPEEDKNKKQEIRPFELLAPLAVNMCKEFELIKESSASEKGSIAGVKIKGASSRYSNLSEALKDKEYLAFQKLYECIYKEKLLSPFLAPPDEEEEGVKKYDENLSSF